MNMELSQQLLAGGFVLALLALAATAAQRRGWLQPRLRDSGRSPQLALIGRLTLTPQHSLHLIRIEHRILLLATHTRGIEVVEEPSSLATRAAGAGTVP